MISFEKRINQKIILEKNNYHKKSFFKHKRNNGTGRNVKSVEFLNGEFMSSFLTRTTFKKLIYPKFTCVDPYLVYGYGSHKFLS